VEATNQWDPEQTQQGASNDGEWGAPPMEQQDDSTHLADDVSTNEVAESGEWGSATLQEAAEQGPFGSAEASNEENVEVTNQWDPEQEQQGTNDDEWGAPSLEQQEDFSNMQGEPTFAHQSNFVHKKESESTSVAPHVDEWGAPSLANAPNASQVEKNNSFPMGKAVGREDWGSSVGGETSGNSERGVPPSPEAIASGEGTSVRNIESVTAQLDASKGELSSGQLTQIVSAVERGNPPREEESTFSAEQLSTAAGGSPTDCAGNSSNEQTQLTSRGEASDPLNMKGASQPQGAAENCHGSQVIEPNIDSEDAVPPSPQIHTSSERQTLDTLAIDKSSNLTPPNESALNSMTSPASPPVQSSSALFGSPSSPSSPGMLGSPPNALPAKNLFASPDRSEGDNIFATIPSQEAEPSAADLFSTAPPPSLPAIGGTSSAEIPPQQTFGQSQNHEMYGVSSAGAMNYQQSETLSVSSNMTAQQYQAPVDMGMGAQPLPAVPLSNHPMSAPLGTHQFGDSSRRPSYASGQYSQHSDSTFSQVPDQQRRASVSSIHSAGYTGHNQQGYESGYPQTYDSLPQAPYHQDAPTFQASEDATSFAMPTSDQNYQNHREDPQQVYQMEPQSPEAEVSLGVNIDSYSREPQTYNTQEDFPQAHDNNELLTGVIPTRRPSSSFDMQRAAIPTNPVQSLGNIQRGDGRPAHAVVSWGFGGRLVIMLPERRVRLGSFAGVNPTPSVPETNSIDGSPKQGGHVEGSLRQGNVRMINVRDLLKDTAKSVVSFPGPLVAPNPTRKAHTKEDVFSFIENAIAECESAHSPKGVLWKYLKHLVQGNGDLVDPDVLHAISTCAKDDTTSEPNLDEFSLPSGSKTISQEAQCAAMREIEALLFSGDREGAVVCAVEAELWSQALVISNFVSVAAYRRVVERFVNATMPDPSHSRTLYMLFAGLGDKALSPPGLSSNSTSTPETGLSSNSVLTNRSFSDSSNTEYLRKTWAQTLGNILLNRTPGDADVMTNLGDRMWNQVGSVEAAHACYLAAGVPLGSTSASRIVLVGGDHRSPEGRKQFVSAETIQRTELLVYSQMLRNASHGSPDSFQPYRLVYAMWLADLGATKEAYNWALSVQDAVKVRSPSKRSQGSPKKSGPFPKYFLRQLDIFMDRLKNCDLKRLEIQETEKKEGSGFFQLRIGSIFGKKIKQQPQQQQQSTGVKMTSSLREGRTASLSSENNASTPQGSQQLNQKLNDSSGPNVKKDASLEPHQLNLPKASDSGDTPTASEKETDKPKQSSKPNSKGKWGISSTLASFKDNMKQGLISALVPVGDAHVAKTGKELDAYYCEERKKWIFPNEAGADDAPAAPSKPPSMAEMRPMSAPTNSEEPTNGPGGPPPPMPNFTAGASFRKGASRSRYVDPLALGGNAMERPETAPGGPPPLGAGMPPQMGVPPSSLAPPGMASGVKYSVFTPPPVMAAEQNSMERDERDS